MEANVIDVSQDDRTVVFTIKSRNEEGEEWEVKRTLDDFKYLHDCLVAGNSGVGIPALPIRVDFKLSSDYYAYDTEKYPEEIEKIENEIKNDYLAKLKKGLTSHQLFLERVISRVPQDSTLSVFLTYQQNLQAKAPSVFNGLIKKLKDSKILIPKLKENDEKIQQKHDLITSQQNHLKDIVKRHNASIKSYTNLTVAQFGITLLCNTITYQYFTRIKRFERTICTNFDSFLAEPLIQYSADTGVMKNLILHRYYSLVEFDDACRGLENARIRGRDTENYEAEEVRTRENFEKVDKTVKKELEVWEEMRNNTLKAKLKELARVQAEESKSFCSYLKAMLDDLRKSII